MNFASKHEGDAFKRIAERAYKQDPVRTENDLIELGYGGFARDLKLDSQIQKHREQSATPANTESG